MEQLNEIGDGVYHATLNANEKQTIVDDSKYIM